MFLSRWHPLIRLPVLFLLFFSGIVSLVGGLLPDEENGYSIGNQTEWTQVDDALKGFSPEAVFAVYPTYNHPALVAGHRVVLGFPGHILSDGLHDRAVPPASFPFHLSPVPSSLYRPALPLAHRWVSATDVYGRL